MPFTKCACPYCEQTIEYPTEGAGQTVPCPTCEQILVLPSLPFAPPKLPTPAVNSSKSAELATENQKERLRSFGCCFDEKLSKNEASEIIEKCYRSNPPTTEQLEKLERMGLSNELPEMPTMGDAREILKHHAPTKKQIKVLSDAGFKLVKSAEMTAQDLDDWIRLPNSPPQIEDLEALGYYGLKFSGDAFATAALTCLIQQFQNLVEVVNQEERLRIARACGIAIRDPEYPKIIFKIDDVGGGVIATWPKSKIREWFTRARA